MPKVKRDDDSNDDITQDKENIKPSSVEKLPDIEQTNSASKEQKRKLSGEKKEAPKVVQLKDNGKNKKRATKKGNFVKRLSNGERLKRIVPDEEIEKPVLTTVNNGDTATIGDKKLTPETTIFRLTGGIELVPLLARRRRVGARTLPSSDVTRPPEQACEYVCKNIKVNIVKSHLDYNFYYLQLECLFYFVCPVLL